MSSKRCPICGRKPGQTIGCTRCEAVRTPVPAMTGYRELQEELDAVQAAYERELAETGVSLLALRRLFRREEEIRRQLEQLP